MIRITCKEPISVVSVVIVMLDSASPCLFFYFRALKTRGNTPKYGLIFHSSFIGRASARNKGRMARYLANKCSIASRIDCFAGKLYHLIWCFFLLEFFVLSARTVYFFDGILFDQSVCRKEYHSLW